jgi:hypothetical protein
MKFSPLPCYVVSLRAKYSPQHPILKDPQPTSRVIRTLIKKVLLLDSKWYFLISCMTSPTELLHPPTTYFKTLKLLFD